MKKQTFGKQIADLRKSRGLTQQGLADQMGVTDKAVSKWERDLSLPDVASIARLAEVLGVSVETLMDPGAHREAEAPSQVQAIAAIVLKAVPLAMGVAVAVTALLGQLKVLDGFVMLGIGMACLAVKSFQE